MISVVAPIFNEVDSLDELVRRISAALEPLDETLEIILVDNGSTDASLNKMRDLQAHDPRVKWISLSRNFGHQGGILAGMHHARGDAVVTIDGDLQHPPELIPKLIEQWRAGHEVVFTTKTVTPGSGVRGTMTRAFYWLISRISHLQLSLGQSDFRLLDRSVVDVICAMPEQEKFLRGLVDWVGYRQVGVEYQPAARRNGETKFSMRNYFSFAINGILSFSTIPLTYGIYYRRDQRLSAGAHQFIDVCQRLNFDQE